MIIADSCIALQLYIQGPRKLKSYRKFAISSEHIALQLNIEQPKNRNAETALV